MNIIPLPDPSSVPPRRRRCGPAAKLVPPLLLAALATACGGGDRVRVSGAFAEDGDDGITAVRAVEAGREVRVEDGEWALDGLAPGPLHLELLRGGRTAGRMALSGLAPGTDVELRGVRADRWTERAFPASVGLRGAESVFVNGLRMTADGTLPARVEVEGEVLAADPDAGLLVVRPADAALPDLRVLLGTRTRLLSGDGDGADADDFGAGERVRLRGMVRDGFVLAEALAPEGGSLDAEADVGMGQDVASGEEDASRSSDVDVDAGSESAVETSPQLPVVREPVREPQRVRENPGRARGKARGQERGRGPKKPKR